MNAAAADLVWRTYHALMRAVRHRAWMWRAVRLVPERARTAVYRAVEQYRQSTREIDFTVAHPVLGHRMFLCSRTDLGQLFVSGVYEKDVVRVLVEGLRPGMTFVDVGAHVGFHTVIAARSVGARGKVYAFEPQPEVRSLLERNVAQNGYRSRCEVLGVAVSDRQGTGRLYLGKRERGHSSFYASDRTAEAIPVETTTLDRFFAGRGWPPVHWVKMDIEGAEAFALRGMRGLVARNPALALIMEFGVHTARDAGYTHVRLARLLHGLGFRIGYWIEAGLRRFELPVEWPATDYGNLLFVQGEGPPT
ncbi:methyltransferase FkbM [Sulfurifustis variabilis]|uniref:Methyltransferase FkbM n=1 Tax=Sulfurifustis variabilis TaxID=1675686 RepID=A0A1B4V6D1_9GAMM|nr:FkbM family methyltransferase [Sulfurifustis variabilis]BAU48122.1 methyltransferase FkbM [Sulfurifustis variabilis]